MSQKKKPGERIYCVSDMNLLDVKCDGFVLQFGNSGGPLINLVSHSPVEMLIIKIQRHRHCDCCAV